MLPKVSAASESSAGSLSLRKISASLWTSDIHVERADCIPFKKSDSHLYQLEIDKDAFAMLRAGNRILDALQSMSLLLHSHGAMHAAAAASLLLQSVEMHSRCHVRMLF